MEKITTILYDEVDFVWILNHWDIHLEGLCNHNGELCYFETQKGTGYWDEECCEDIERECDEYVEVIPNKCDIYSLTKEEKQSWLKRKRKFEVCVGYHWTYPYRKTGERPYGYKKPKWFWNLLTIFYYKFRRCK